MSGSVTSSGPLQLTTSTIESMILDEFDPGQSLPSEHDLADRLRVSRLTVREALKVLSGRGLVELGRGRRPVVRASDPDVLSGYLAAALRRDPRGLLELGEIRQSLEVLSATSAARETSRAALVAVESAVAEMEDVAARLDRQLERAVAGGADPGEALGEADLDPYHQADLRFHEALALASGNRMLGFLLESLAPCLAESFRASARGHLTRHGTVGEVAQAHRDILDAVAAGDVAAAERTMRTHLRAAGRDLRASMGGTGRPERRRRTGAADGSST